eukprot:Polyplicarium_translucidae@DN877_c0_g1_i2.p1
MISSPTDFALPPSGEKEDKRVTRELRTPIRGDSIADLMLDPSGEKDDSGVESARVREALIDQWTRNGLPILPTIGGATGFPSDRRSDEERWDDYVRDASTILSRVVTLPIMRGATPHTIESRDATLFLMEANARIRSIPRDIHQLRMWLRDRTALELRDLASYLYGLCYDLHRFRAFRKRNVELKRFPRYWKLQTILTNNDFFWLLRFVMRVTRPHMLAREDLEAEAAAKAAAEAAAEAKVSRAWTPWGKAKARARVKDPMRKQFKEDIKKAAGLIKVGFR